MSERISIFRSMRLIWVLVLLCICLQVLSTELDSVRTEKRGEKWVVIHQVDPGETLYSIARRYQADISIIADINGIQDNNIRSGQLLEIPIATPKKSGSEQVELPINKQIHIVEAGETLFSIGKKYGVKASQIIAWNDLKDESLSIGQQLILKSKSNIESKERKELLVPFKGALKHYVQSGENIEQIAEKRNVSRDSLKRWNNLLNFDLKIGQILWYRPYERKDKSAETYEIFGKHVVEGIATQIEDMETTDKYLALHKELPTGTLLEIRNLMNNKKVYVRVIGQLPSTGINQDILVRLTPISFKRLGILDARARVELTYYDE